jgi:hypothetical protein
VCVLCVCEVAFCTLICFLFAYKKALVKTKCDLAVQLLRHEDTISVDVFGVCVPFVHRQLFFGQLSCASQCLRAALRASPPPNAASDTKRIEEQDSIRDMRSRPMHLYLVCFL